MHPNEATHDRAAHCGSLQTSEEEDDLDGVLAKRIIELSLSSVQHSLLFD